MNVRDLEMQVKALLDVERDSEWRQRLWESQVTLYKYALRKDIQPTTIKLVPPSIPSSRSQELSELFDVSRVLDQICNTNSPENLLRGVRGLVGSISKRLHRRAECEEDPRMRRMSRDLAVAVIKSVAELAEFQEQLAKTNRTHFATPGVLIGPDRNARKELQ